MVGTRIRSRQRSIAAAGRFRSKANYVWKDTSLGCSLYHHRRSSTPVGKGIKVITLCDGDLTGRDLPRRAEVASELPSFTRIKNWMESVFTVDEKWCLYVNIMHSPPWVDQDEQHEPQPMAGFHLLKVMVSSWGDCKAIIHCEVLSRYTALTADLHYQLLERMTAKIAGKGGNHGTIQFLHDPARPLFIRVARQKLPDFGWEVVTSALYRPDLVPRDYQLLLADSNALQGKAGYDEDDLDLWLSNFFESLPVQF
ncbi:hypothetical protein Y032_0053g2285 [Ancylostoma ceylanicum]|uniref:Uncharacterized protein n=1 Tax=Ancylostoma ceylanicum TaxID=53326 RepID=A0A016U6G7_9BILA|nr:hypothetical protein Y032_0053g2285 [Ancylostoma ceylanicum]